MELETQFPPLGAAPEIGVGLVEGQPRVVALCGGAQQQRPVAGQPAWRNPELYRHLGLVTEREAVHGFLTGAEFVLWGGVNAVYSRIMGSHKPARAVVPVMDLHYGYQIADYAFSSHSEAKATTGSNCAALRAGR